MNDEPVQSGGHELRAHELPAQSPGVGEESHALIAPASAPAEAFLSDTIGATPDASAGLLPATPSVAASPVAPRPRPSASGLAGSIQSMAITVVIAVFVITFAVQAFQIPSESMENTLLIGDYLLVDKVHFSKSDFWSRLLPYELVSRGDVIVFRYPVNPTQHFVKRVIAIPGDRVRLINKQAWVNGEPVNERYAVFHSMVSDPYRDDFPNGYYPQHVSSQWWTQMESLVQGGDLRVPPGQYFVLGDNRDESLDSRYWGLVPRENIVGRPLLIYFSVGTPPGFFPRAEASSDKLARFAEAVTSAVRGIRWERTLKLVR